MKQHTASEVREHFAEILNLVRQGEDVEITRHGEAVATITRPKPRSKQKIPAPGWGLKEGWSIKIAEDFVSFRQGCLISES